MCRSKKGEKLQMSSVSEAQSRSRPPSTPTAASSGMLRYSWLIMAGIEISTPASSPRDIAAQHARQQAAFQTQVHRQISCRSTRASPRPRRRSAANHRAKRNRWFSVRCSRSSMRLTARRSGKDAGQRRHHSQFHQQRDEMASFGIEIAPVHYNSRLSPLKEPCHADSSPFGCEKSPKPIFQPGSDTFGSMDSKADPRTGRRRGGRAGWATSRRRPAAAGADPFAVPDRRCLP